MKIARQRVGKNPLITQLPWETIILANKIINFIELNLMFQTVKIFHFY